LATARCSSAAGQPCRRCELCGLAPQISNDISILFRALRDLKRLWHVQASGIPWHVASTSGAPRSIPCSALSFFSRRLRACMESHCLRRTPCPGGMPPTAPPPGLGRQHRAVRVHAGLPQLPDHLVGHQSQFAGCCRSPCPDPFKLGRPAGVRFVRVA